MPTPKRRETPYRVLLIGNDTNELGNIQEKLSKINSLSCTSQLSTDSSSAIALLLKESFDIFFVCYQLDRMNCFDFLTKIRTENVLCPAILLADNDIPETLTTAVEMGFDEYLIQKDLNLFQLERSVINAISKKQITNKINESELSFRCVVESLSEGVLIIDLDDKIIFVNNHFTQMIDRNMSELKHQLISETVISELQWESLKSRMSFNGFQVGEVRNEILLKFEGKDPMWAEVKVSPYRDVLGNKQGHLLVVTDISSRKEVEEKLFHNTFHDHLTGLPNRVLFLDRLGQSKSRSRKFDQLLALLIIDIDRFKLVSDSLGTSVSDKLLNEFAIRTKSLIRKEDTLARIGTDIFAILLEDVYDIRDTTHLVSKIHKMDKQSFNINNKEIYITTCVGVALDFDIDKTPEDLMRDAETAVHLAKLKGPSQYELFNKDMHERAVNLMELENDMRRVLERNELCVNFQPIISLINGTITGFEALVRWQHPKRGLVSPSEFIPVAEDTGLILPMGLWILENACKKIRSLQDITGQNYTLSVNLSGKQLSETDLAKKINDILTRTRFDSQLLRLEITESAIMEDAEEAINLMNKLRQLDIELYIDDFGTGYSSLSYLHRFPVTALKIDISFVNRMSDSHSDLEIVRTIVNLAHNLKMVVIAEGIENKKQLSLLRQLRCEFGQGYLMSKALGLEDLKELLSSNPQW